MPTLTRIVARSAQHEPVLQAATLMLLYAVALQPLVAQSESRRATRERLFDYQRTTVRLISQADVDTMDGVSQTLLTLVAAPTDSIVARLFVPMGATARRPAIIMGHGAPGSGATVGPRARYFARKGAVVLVVDAPFVRRDPAVPMTMSPLDSVELVQQVINYRRAVDYLRARPDVNDSRIGFVGGSHSAYVGALFVGVERRLRAAVLAMGDVGYVEHFREANGSWNRYFPSELPPEQINRWVSSLQPLDGASWLAQSRVQHLLLQSALNDEAVPRHAAEKLHSAAPKKATHEWYDSGHRVSAEAYFAQLQFLSRALGLESPVLRDEAGPYGSGRPLTSRAREAAISPAQAH